MEGLKPDTVIIVAGSPGAGKSNMIKYIVKNMIGSLHYGIAICPTADDGYDWLPQPWVHYFLTEGLIENLIAIQDTHKSNHAFLILDDCLGSINWNADLWKRLITTTRHTRLTVIIATQYINQIPTFYREVAHFAFVFPQSSFQAIEGTWKAFGQSFSSSKEWNSFLSSNTRERFSCLLYTRGIVNPYKKLTAPNMDTFKVKLPPPPKKKKSNRRVLTT